MNIGYNKMTTLSVGWSLSHPLHICQTICSLCGMAIINWWLGVLTLISITIMSTIGMCQLIVCFWYQKVTHAFYRRLWTTSIGEFWFLVKKSFFNFNNFFGDLVYCSIPCFEIHSFYVLFTLVFASL